MYRALTMLKSHDPMKSPAQLILGVDVSAAMKKLCSEQATFQDLHAAKVSGFISFGGLPVIVDYTLPADEWRVRDGYGATIQRGRL